MSAQPPSGWYPDPEDQSRQRYWNGFEWTEHTAGTGDGTTQPAVSPSDPGGPGSGWPSGGSTVTRASTGTGGSLNTWNWQAWVVTLLCGGTFVSMIGIYNAGKAEGALAAGDRARAEGFAQSARNWTLGGLAFGLLSIVAVIALVVSLGAGIGDLADDCSGVTDTESFQYAFCQGYCESAPADDPTCEGFVG